MRLISVTYSRKGIDHSIRHYARIDTALPAIIKNLLLYGHPRDAAAVYGRETGVWICDVSVHAGGKIRIDYK